MNLLTWQEFLQVLLMAVALMPIVMLLISWIFSSYYVAKRNYVIKIFKDFAGAFEKTVNEIAKNKEEKHVESESNSEAQ